MVSSVSVSESQKKLGRKSWHPGLDFDEGRVLDNSVIKESGVRMEERAPVAGDVLQS